MTVTFVYTNDMHGVFRGSDESAFMKLKPAQGLLRISTLIKRVKSENPNTIALDAGDALHGTPMMYVFRGEPVAELMNAAGYDIITLGNHDFEWKMQVASERVARAKQDVVVSNAVFPPGYDFSAVKPYVIREIGGVKVAIAGLFTDETLKFIWPGYIQGLEIEPAEKALERLYPDMLREADYIVLLSHLGTANDLQIATSSTGADLILGGHSHNVIFPPIQIGKTYIMNSGAYGLNLGRVDVDFAPGDDGRMKPVGVRASMIPADESVTEDPELVPVYEQYRTMLADVMSLKVAESWAIAGDKKRTGDRAADLLREATGADIAFIGAGQISGEMGVGPVAVKDFYKVMTSYSRQNIVLGKLSGAQIADLIERSANGTKAANGIYFSGIKYEISSDAAGKSIVSITVNGNPLDSNAGYLVASTGNFIMERTDLLSADPGGVADTGETLRDVVMKQLGIGGGGNYASGKIGKTASPPDEAN